MAEQKKKLTPKRERYAMSTVKPKSYEERYPESFGCLPEKGKPSSPPKTLPSFSLNSREVPEVAAWKQGEEYMVRVRMAGRDERISEKDGKKSNEVSGRFDIIAVSAGSEDDSEDEA